MRRAPEPARKITLGEPSDVDERKPISETLDNAPFEGMHDESG
jgi:hypothetical protein